MKVINPLSAPPCVHCGHPYIAHKRPDVPADVAVYIPCSACDCAGWSDTDPYADDPLAL